jgi:hypothetical protein
MRGLSRRNSGGKRNLSLREENIMFSTGLLLAAGGTVCIAIADKALEDTGFFWIGTVLKLIVPLAGMAMGVYFLEHNPINGWLK